MNQTAENLDQMFFSHMRGRHVKALIKEALTDIQKSQEPQKPKHIRGRGNAAKELGVSMTKMIQLEKAGIIKPTAKRGRIILYDYDTMIEAMKQTTETNE